LKRSDASVNAKEEGKTPLLMIQSIERYPYGRLPDTLKQTFYRKDRKLRTEIVMSPVDRRWRVIVDDSPVLQKGFETKAEAEIFLRGFVIGFTTGAGATAAPACVLLPEVGGEVTVKVRELDENRSELASKRLSRVSADRLKFKSNQH
jgi:hypothetical protein